MSAAPAVAQAPKGAPAASATAGGMPIKATKADADRDRISEELEQRLAPRRAGDRVEVIVTLERAASSARVRGLERRVGNLGVSDRFRVVDAFAATATKRQVEALARRPGVEAVQADGRVRAQNAAGSNAFGVTKARVDNPSLDGDRDGAPARYSPSDMVAAVLDTGIDARHYDLNERKVLAFANCTGGGCVARPPFDDDGHGTHISATLAGDGDARTGRPERGVAPAAALVGVKVLGADGGGSESDVIRGIDWTIANRSRYGIEAVNMSLGGDTCSDGTDAMSRAANRAAGAGMLVVAAAGNDGPGRCTISAPGAASAVLAVGSMADTAHNGFLSSWTSGRGAYGQTVKPDVMGPGVSVVSARSGTLSGYTTKSGTSSASPFVAGVGLLMRDANPALPASDIRTRLKGSTIDWGPAGPDIDFGWGRLDGYRALQSSRPDRAGLTRPPSAPAHAAFQGTLSRGQSRRYPLEVRDRCRPIAISLIVKNHDPSRPSSNDLDLYLTDPSGRVVNDAEFVDGRSYLEGTYIERQEDLTHRPDGVGTWTLEVRGAAGSSGYAADVSAGLADPPPGASATCSSR